MSDIPSWARAGVAVECVANAIQVAGTDLGFPLFKKGERYVIAGVDVDPRHGVFLWFKGVSHLHTGHVNGFRPLTEADDAALFRHHLRQPVDA